MTTPGSDGGANLNDALAVARRGDLAGTLGPVVVMNGEIHAARFVAKRHTLSLSAFSSPDAGPVGSITEGQRLDLVRSELCRLRRCLPGWPLAAGRTRTHGHGDGSVLA